MTVETQQGSNSAAGEASVLTEMLEAWIPVADRKPPDGVRVLTYPGWTTTDGVEIDEWCEQYGCFLMGIEEGDNVTHWMPLPKTPNGGDKRRRFFPSA